MERRFISPHRIEVGAVGGLYARTQLLQAIANGSDSSN